MALRLGGSRGSGRRAARWALSLCVAGGPACAARAAGERVTPSNEPSVVSGPPSPIASVEAPVSSAPASAPASPSTPPASRAVPVPAAVPPMKPPIETAMADDLRALSLDPQSLPPIGKLDPRALRGVMKLISRSLGAKCGDCHEEGDFSAPTPRKRIAAKMWDEFVVKLALEPEGAPLFCDSCHQGQMKELDRSDTQALSRWMQTSFVEKLERKDAAELTCETCHVGMQMRFLNKWGAGL